MKQIELGTILHMEKGKKPKLQSKDAIKGYLPYVDIKAFEQGIIDNYASTEKVLLCEDGDLLIVGDGSRSGLTGRAIKGIVGSTLYKIYADGMTTDYLRYFIESKYLLLNTQKKGTGTPHLNANILKKSKLIVPSIEEQERIVAKIEELFSDLDNAVETLNATKTQLEVYRQAVLKEAFEGKLTAKWRERNNIDYSFNKVNIKALVKKEKNSLKAGPFGSSLKKEFYVSNGYKIYGQEQVIAGDECIGDYYVNEEKYQELITCKVSPRDVLISLVGTVGKVLILSRECKAGLINPRLIKISLDENIMIPEYFKYYFESDFIKTLYKSKAHGATMDVLNMSMIKELPFLLCSIKEQEQIIYEIESRMSEYYNIENTVNMVLQQTSAMRQSILKQAFEGRLL
ncbi:restriction endonuclease subunit S [Parvimonas micra]|uniref:restriction endonuclease subunit S n=1 Tax=Parvimonas micra TaxID=33033 RepID=UPI0022B5E535|nr:restriction endonuclease subunit S [Parvimonas micra]WBB29567.1 restriction endonuclease subunit S [Parvimonas micra]